MEVFLVLIVYGAFLLTWTVLVSGLFYFFRFVLAKRKRTTTDGAYNSYTVHVK